ETSSTTVPAGIGALRVRTWFGRHRADLQSGHSSRSAGLVTLVASGRTVVRLDSRTARRPVGVGRREENANTLANLLARAAALLVRPVPRLSRVPAQTRPARRAII